MGRGKGTTQAAKTATAPTRSKRAKKQLYRPQDQEYMLGQCAAYATALMDLDPNLRLGTHWRFSKPGDEDYDTEAGQDYEGADYEDESTWPEQQWPEHYFAHDEKYAYDAMGRHKLPYEGWDETSLWDDPDDVTAYGMYESGYVEPATEHIKENDVFNTDAYEPGFW
jgi:hypothetical protein